MNANSVLFCAYREKLELRQVGLRCFHLPIILPFADLLTLNFILLF